MERGIRMMTASNRSTPRQDFAGANSASDTWGRSALIVVLVLFGVAIRVVPHEWNVAPMGAIALFAGAHFRSRFWGVATPLIALLLSDAIMHLLYLSGLHVHPGFYPRMEFNYLAFAAVAGVGMLLCQGRTECHSVLLRLASIGGAAIVGSLVFFLISNFGAWLALPDLYARTPQGLVECYIKGIPFYRATLLGDLIFVPLVFGTFALARHLFPASPGARRPVPS
jgi:hypothetical protein